MSRPPLSLDPAVLSDEELVALNRFAPDASVSYTGGATPPPAGSAAEEEHPAATQRGLARVAAAAVSLSPRVLRAAAAVVEGGAGDDPLGDARTSGGGVSFRPAPSMAEAMLRLGGERGRAIAAGDGSEEGDGADGPGGPRADFVLYERIGRGGQGQVWRAWQSSLSREVAVKQSFEGSVVDFLHEAYTSAELDHPNIVPVYDMGRESEASLHGPMMAMKLVRGETWIRLLRADRAAAGFDADSYYATHLRILVDVTNAVAYAHAKGILHRDLKPHQVMVGRFGEVYLMDWGMATSVDDDVPTSTREGLPKFRPLSLASNCSGTPIYMAPEQTRKATDVLGFHTDIYLLGAILYEVITGRAPHAAATSGEAYRRACENDYDPLPDDCPEELQALVIRALATDPRDRPASAEEFRDAIQAFLSGSRRREESRAVAAEVAGQLALLDAAGEAGYAALSDMRSRVARALALWPQNAAAERLGHELHARHARLAVEAGDLALAASLLDTMAEGAPGRATLEEELAAARGRVARRERQRRLAVRGLAVLGAALLVAGFAMYRDHARLAEQERLAERLRAASSLLAEEATLARRLGAAAPLPADLAGDGLSAEAREAALGELPALLERRDALRSERDRLAVELPDAARLLGEEPFEIALAEATAELLRGTPEAAARAREAFERIVAARPDSLEALRGAAIAAHRAGDAVAAALMLDDAAGRVAARHGAESAEHAAALALAGMAFDDATDDVEVARRYYERSADILAPRWVASTNELAERLVMIGRMAEAVAVTSSALAVVPDDGRPLDPASFRLRLLHVQALGHMARYPEAEESALRLIAAIEAEPDPPAMKLGRAHFEFGVLLTSMGRGEEALARLRRGRELMEASGGVGRGEEDLFRDREAHARLELGDYEGARALFEEAERRQAQRAPGSNGQAVALYALGNTDLYLGRHAEAAASFERALAIRQRLMGEDSLGVAEVRFGLGRAYTFLERNAEAEEQLRAAVAVAERIFGATHPNVSAAWSSIGMAQFQQGKVEDSIASFRRVVANNLRTIGPAHPSTMISAHNLANILLRAGQGAEAEVLYRFAYEGFLRARGPRHPNTERTHAALVTMAAYRDDAALRADAPRYARYAASYAAEFVDPAAPLATPDAQRPVVLTTVMAADFLARLDPPRTEAARAQCRRLVAHRAIAPSAVFEEGVRERYERYLEEMVAAEERAAIEERAAAFLATLEARAGAGDPLTTGDLLAFLAEVGPAVDWAAEFPAVADWGIEGAEDADALLAEVCAQMGVTAGELAAGATPTPR